MNKPHALSIEDYAKMNKITDESIQQGYESAQEEWRESALEVVKQVCLEIPTFTVNDVRERVKLLRIKTHDNRAMGGVMKMAEKRNWIQKTGESIPSVVGHKVHIQIWRSNLFDKKVTLF